jgi:hypothetical protein
MWMSGRGRNGQPIGRQRSSAEGRWAWRRSDEEDNSGSDGVLITRLVGMSIQQGALKRMETLYTKMGDDAKARMAQQGLRGIEMEREEMRRTAQEAG